MSRFLMCFAFGFVCNLVTAQKVEWLPTRPYEKIKFDSLQPVWYHTFYDPKSIGGDTCDGYNFVEFIARIKPLIAGDFIYLALGTRNTKDLNTGALIEKRRLSDGELVWQSSLTYPEVGRQEVPRFMRINDNDQLEVFYLKRNKPFNLADPFFILKSGVSYDMGLSIRIFDTHNGNIISYQNLTDSTNSNIKYTYSWSEVLGLSTTYEIQDSLVHTGLFGLSGKFSYVTHFHDTNGNYQRTDTFKISGIQKGSNFIKIGNDSLIIMEEVYNKPTRLHLFDGNFQLLKTIETETLDYPKDIKLIRANKQGLLLECLEKKELLQLTYQLVFMDYDGKIRKKVSFVNENTYYRIYDVLDWSMNGELLLIAKKYVKDSLENPQPNINFDVSQAIDFWYASGDNNLTRIKRYKSTDNKRYALPWIQESVKLDNGDYIVFLLESAIDTISLKSGGFENDFDARASSIMRITPQQAGLSVTYINETTPSGLLFEVFPNPVKDKLHIVASNSNIDFISIKDVYGRLCYHEFISGKSDLEFQKEISMKDMMAGIYFITLSTGSRTQTLKLIVE